jgi:C_GCAxxG_C_C family probable redox protein
MSIYLDRSHQLRDDPTTHYNCAQAVFIPFAEAKGLSFEAANAITANFGAGMRIASVCGAMTGALMALGLYGADDGPTVAAFFREMRNTHDGNIECKDLLSAYHAAGGRDKKPHCDGMVYQCVALVEQMLTEKGLL